MTLRLLITGSRGWRNTDKIERALLAAAREANVAPSDVVVVHGGAGGADELAGGIAEALGMQTEVHLADWDGLGKSAGYVRNEHMVSLGADHVLAFWDGSSRGTAHTLRLATVAGLPLTVFKQLPNGK